MRLQRSPHLCQVVSSKMMKSATVAVTRMFRHPRLDATVKKTKKYMVRRLTSCLHPCSRAARCEQAHDELNQCNAGDLVRLEETRPLSRHKRCASALFSR